MSTKNGNKGTIIGATMFVLIIAFCAMVGKLWENVDQEQIVVKQAVISGERTYFTDAGLKWQGWGRITEYQKTQQLWFNNAETYEGAEDAVIPVVFNEGSYGAINGSLRVKLPTNAEQMERIYTDYPSMDKLMRDLIRPTVVKVVYASGPLMSAFESYAEKKNDLIAYITDQLNHGVYRTQVTEQEIYDPLTEQEKTVKIASLIPNQNSAGGYERQEVSPFSWYGIEVGQVAVSKIDYEEKVIAQIATQQESNMLIQTARAQALAARQEAVRVEEAGRATAAKAKWDQEAIKATAVTRAEQEKEVAELDAQRANFEKAAIVARGQAEAEAARLKVAAGLRG